MLLAARLCATDMEVVSLHHEGALAYALRLAIGKAAINAAAAASTGAGDRVLSGGASQVFDTANKKRGIEGFLKMGVKAFADGAIAFEVK
jgi:hypothetical protein